MQVFIFVLLAVLFSGSLQSATEDAHGPKLLLNAQRLRRLKRDRERQTERWMNFEHRVKTVHDSPERGFELALFYAVTGEDAIGKQASAWARAHPCELRQVALVADWVESPIPPTTNCKPKALSELERIRDSAFLSIAAGDSPLASPDFLPAVTRASFATPGPLYAAIEYLDAIRSARREDLRENAVRFFVNLPVLLLVSLPPEELAAPNWRIHAAALALVSLDPNLEGSQFLQSWAMEESQTIQDGPGVAYEFLWGNPYLPGVGYRNMEPALYDEDASRLVARTSWDDDACRVEIMPGSVQSQHCPADWRTRRMEFGHLTLVPMEDRCFELSSRPNNTTTILWNLKPRAKLVYIEDGKQQSRNADGAGMWRASAEYRGKVCAVK